MDYAPCLNELPKEVALLFLLLDFPLQFSTIFAMFEPALQLLYQGNELATQEQFSDADRVCRAAASLSGGKPLWNFKSLGFCPTVFQDESD